MNTYSSNTQIDAEYIRYIHEMIGEEYHYLNTVHTTSEKLAFLNEGVLDFKYPSAQLSFHVLEDALKRAEEAVSKSDMPEPAIRLYLDKCTEQRHIQSLLRSVVDGDDLAVHEASKAIYGEPEPKLFWFTVDQINRRFRSLIAKVEHKRNSLHQEYDIWKQYVDSLQKPERIGSYQIPFYEGVYYPNEYEEIESAEKIRTMFIKYLEKLEIDTWSVVIDSPGARSSFGVEQSTKTINIPHDSDISARKSIMNHKLLRALLDHEIGVHVVRREQGEQSQLALLGAGFSQYIRGEEGVATFAEQLITGTESYAGEVSYFAAGAAMGTVGTPLRFHELFTILNVYFTLLIADRQLDTEGYYELEEVRSQALNAAWSRCVRIFRGTSGQTPGAIYTRDIVYREGNRNIWKLADHEPALRPEWLIGKYDPANRRHTEALTELGMLGSVA